MNDCHNSTIFAFQLSAFSLSEEEEFLLFAGVFLIYLVSVLGNAIITALVCLMPQLHTPMYFFLCNLSISDIIYTSTTLPKLMYILLTLDKKISFSACIIQACFFGLCALCEILILTSMSYDRYVAICRPLQYLQIMNRDTCNSMAACCWILSAIISIVNITDVSRLSFCNLQNVDHYYCELKTLYAITFSDALIRNNLLVFQDILFGCFTFSVIFISYGFIISTILKIRSSENRSKAFSSCSSHLTTLILFYGPIMTMYAKPHTARIDAKDKFLSLIYVAVVPMLNPFVYTLRNKEFFNAFKNMARILTKQKPTKV